ncbi:uncharacterized protein RCC_08170 [Ramularia collo-cygni]|uniref:Peroxin/Ferlin domain-containing protein n=1 Tax=Ramularia collo-cygni TaxID=112498 RepID=A0A2D3UZF1_9PEZI|nr:uncharacterized protein RCC_08170 [Ramularia collo-cygni]CZT22301.1 uncharacterized protein RCC_08170 [Ramularia collo-cygni]
MSETSSLARIPSPSRIKAEHHIVLDDHTASKKPSFTHETDAERGDGDSDTPPTPGQVGLYKRLTNNSSSVRQSVRQEYNKQKYARYGQGRYHFDDAHASDSDAAEAGASSPIVGQEASAVHKGYLERAQSKAKGMVSRKRTLGKGDQQDTVIDILYENQRGMFFFGIPKYSNKSLLPADPKPWQNAQFRTSAVDIRNAQVPDPGWEWAWKGWYVDMSRDVDEEGWEYSFAFVGKGATTFAWHGTHPWFHSFVRRRRWLRMRKRKDTTHRTKEKSHELTADYFTIHPKTVRPTSIFSGQNGSIMALAKLREPVLDVEQMEITTIGELFLALKRSSVDREKIVAVRKFTNEGGDELYYLGERMEEIMGMFIFQSSRRQLLGDLISRHDKVHKEQNELAAHQHEEDEEKQKAHETAARHASNLLKAVHAADEQVKRLEYWSDQKGITDTSAAANGENGHSQPSFMNKQPARAGAPALHKAQSSYTNGQQSASDTAYEAAPDAPTRESSVFYDSESKNSKGRESSTGDDDKPPLERFTTAPESKPTLERFTTAPEGVPDDDQKSEIQVRSPTLDGVAEAAEEGQREHRNLSPTKRSKVAGRSVQIVEPAPFSPEIGESEDDLSDGDGDVINRNDTKTPDSIRQFMIQMRAPKNWIDQAFG